MLSTTTAREGDRNFQWHAKEFELCAISKWNNGMSHAWEWHGQICFKKDYKRECGKGLWKLQDVL